MLRIGLTGGIAAGKSLVARRFEELGAVLVDADVLARAAVEPGSEGLREVVEAFGGGILTAEGALDRPALGRVIFDDARARERLNGIVHPRVRSAAAQVIASAPEQAVVVEDIPLLVETGQAARFHLVVVVDAPEAERLRRMVEDRGMRAHEAEQRVRSQASDADRLREADAVLENAGTPDEVLAAADALWMHRVLPFASNLAAGRPAMIVGSTSVPDGAMGLGGTSDLTRRISARLADLLPPGRARSIEVDGDARAENYRSPKDAGGVDLRVLAEPADDAAAMALALSARGFPPVDAVRHGEGHGGLLFGGADPATSVRVRIVPSVRPASNGSDTT